MRKRSLLVLLLILSLLLAGCSKEGDPGTTRPVETEPTATYDWMAGESPVPNQRSGVYRAGVNNSNIATSPAGVYYVPDLPSTKDSYIWYVDHGSDTTMKLCGRADCIHSTPDCNAYVYDVQTLSYYDGYLFAVSGGHGSSEECKLIRMDPDGSNRVTMLDILAFAKANGGDYVECNMITGGICLFSTYAYLETESGTYESTWQQYYIYKLDGSMNEPKAVNGGGWILYTCGDVYLTYRNDTQNGGEYGSYWDWDPETENITYLTDHPGQPGWYGEKEAYYFRDGAIRRLTYETQTEESMVDTGLEGNYYLFSFPDCLVVVSRDSASSDDNMYIYNWKFELVDTVRINYSHSGMNHQLLVAETAERFILSDGDDIPAYYINKSELGTGNVEIHSFVHD